MGNGSGMGWMFVWPLVLVGIVLLVVFLARRSARTTGRGGGLPNREIPRSGAEELLSERYARGDITDEEYRARLQRLRGQADR